MKESFPLAKAMHKKRYFEKIEIWRTRLKAFFLRCGKVKKECHVSVI